MNGDRPPDLIVANAGGDTVSMLVNTTAPGAATPSFATQQTFATGNGSASVTAADVNGDSLPDLIVANATDDTVSVLLNTTAPGAAAPSFATQQTFATGDGPVSVTAADVNGDGLADLIVANANDSTVSVLLNTTAPGAAIPSFAPQQAFATGNFPDSVTVADINGDGKSDLIVSNENDNTLSVLLNTTATGASTLNFAAQQTFATGSLPFSGKAVDVNTDGRPDLIVANQNDHTVSVLLNDLYATTVSGSSATGTIHYGASAGTPTATATDTPTATATSTATGTATATATATATSTATATATVTATDTPTATATSTATPTAIATRTATATATDTATETPTATDTPTPTATRTATATATATATSTATATATPTPTPLAAPTSKAQCTNVGWTQWEGPPFDFRNQGNCISYVNAHP